MDKIKDKKSDQVELTLDQRLKNLEDQYTQTYNLLEQIKGGIAILKELKQAENENT
jgi:hypothetical protein